MSLPEPVTRILRCALETLGQATFPAVFSLFVVFTLFGAYPSSSQTKVGTDHPDARQKFVDRQNGFSVYYGAGWQRAEPNEEVTKLLVISPSGYRCWVTTIQNPYSTGENAKQLVEYLVKNPQSVEKNLKQIYQDVYVASIRPVQMSGQYYSALLSYSFQYTAFDSTMVVGALETHIFIKGFTYKVGCSAGSDGINTEEFQSGSTTFLRSFMIIPRNG